MFDIKGTFLKGDHNVKLLFFGILLFEFSPVMLSAIVTLSKNSIPILMETALSIFFFLAMLVFLTLYLTRRTQNTDQKQPVRWINGIVTGITVYMLVGVLILCISTALKASYGFVVKQPVGTSVVSLAVITGCAVAIFLAAFILYASIMLLMAAFKFNIPPGRQWSAFLLLTVSVFKRFLHSVIVLLTALAFSAIALAAVPYLALYLERSFPNAFGAVFIQALVIAAAETYILYFLVNTAESGIERYHARLMPLGTGQSFQPQAQGQPYQPAPGALQEEKAGRVPKIGVPWFAVIVAAILVCLAIFHMPVQRDIFNELEDQVNILAGQGEMAFEMGWTDLAAVKHKKAYSMILATEGYIKGLISQNPSSGEKLMTESTNYWQDLDAAFKYDMSNVWVHIFRGFLSNNSNNFKDGANNFSIALRGTQKLPDIYFGALKSYTGLKDEKNTAKMVELIIRNQFFRGGMEGTCKLSPSALSKKLKQFEDLKEEHFENLALSAMEKLKYNDSKGMFDDITALLQTDPDNESLLFLYGVAAMSYRPESQNYALANSTYDRLLEVSGQEEGAAYLKGYMSLLTKDYNAAEAKMKEIYEKYPDSTGFGEQYAYALFLTGKNDEAVKVADEIIAIDNENWFCHYIKSMIYLKTAKFADSLSEIGVLMKITQKDLADGYLDQYLYAYSLAYSMYTRDQACMQALEAMDKSSLLYIYITGTTAWRDKDYSKAEEYLTRILEIESKLAHAEYLLGNVYYERSVMNNTTEFDKAEKHYLASLAMNPEHATGWFALAHNYDKWKGHEVEALRAFRKVVDLIPSSDHTRDYYGMTVHAQGNIDRLLAYEQEGG